MATVREGESGMNWEIRFDINILPYVKQTVGGNLWLHSTGTSAPCSVMMQMCGMGVWGRREVQEGGDICIHITDSLCCIAETNITL